MEALLYFGIWAGFFFVMMRLGHGAHIMGIDQTKGQTQTEPGTSDNSELRWVPPKKDADPVCGKTVTTDNAKPSVYAGNVYYFAERLESALG